MPFLTITKLENKYCQMKKLNLAIQIEQTIKVYLLEKSVMLENCSCKHHKQSVKWNCRIERVLIVYWIEELKVVEISWNIISENICHFVLKTVVLTVKALTAGRWDVSWCLIYESNCNASWHVSFSAPQPLDHLTGFGCHLELTTKATNEMVSTQQLLAAFWNEFRIWILDFGLLSLRDFGLLMCALLQSSVSQPSFTDLATDGL